jgi:hypothetical protein
VFLFPINDLQPKALIISHWETKQCGIQNLEPDERKNYIRSCFYIICVIIGVPQIRVANILNISMSAFFVSGKSHEWYVHISIL